MKTILLCQSYLDGKDAQGNERHARIWKYLEYYSSIADKLGIERIRLMDNGSKTSFWQSNTCQVPIEFYSVRNLAHGPNLHYPHCWVNLYYQETLIKEGYEKIINIDSDAFIVSNRLADYVKNLDSGWATLLCKRYNWPASEVSILCKDAFPVFHKYTEVPWQRRVGKLMERDVPYTIVNMDFDCDRYGESKAPLTEKIDLYAQMGPEIIPRLI